MRFPLAFLFDKTESETKVANRHILSYAVGLTGQNMTYSYISSWLRYFCINILKINSETVGLIFGASHIWDAINDPLIGAYVDKRKHKPYRKLRPFLLYTPPIIGVLSAMMFLDISSIVHTESKAPYVIYIIAIYFIWDLIYSFQDVGLWGMIALSSPASEERARVAQWVSIGAGAGGAIAGIFQQLRQFCLNAGLNDAQIFFMFALVFGLGGELISMLAYRIPERIENKPQEENIFQSIAVLRHNPTLLLISLARFSMAFSPKVQAAYFFENKITFMNGKTAEFVYGFCAGIPGTFATFFANKIAKKVGGMKKLLIISQLAAIAMRLIAFKVGYNSIGQFIAMIILMGIMNLPGSLMDIAHRSLTSNSIDEVEYKTGLRSEGVSFSMQNFTTKLTSGVASVIEGQLLGKHFLNYDPVAREQGLPQNEVFLKWQWPMYMLGPIVGAVLYLIVISFVKDDKDKRLKIEEELKQRRALALAEQSKEAALS